MDVQRIEVELQGQKWQLVVKPWPYKVGRRWITKIVKLLGGLAASPNLGPIGTADLLDTIDDEMLDQLVACCEKNTACVPCVGDKPKAVPFEELEPLLVGRYDVTLLLVKAHMEVTFGPFFASLPGALRDLEGEAPKAAT